jgi:small subunit ribosomal protein S18
MPAPSSSSGPRRRPPGKFRRPRRKVCTFCVDKATYIDYKAVAKLRKFVTERGKIVARRTSGTCAGHQRQLTDAIKRARHMALIHYVSE